MDESQVIGGIASLIVNAPPSIVSKGCTEDAILTIVAVDLAEHLVNNGVTIRERGEWGKISHISDASCSKCGRSPKMLFGMLPDFCPHCGADMRGVKDA